MIEEIYPIGNELYRDTTGIYFLLPEINSQELQAEIIELIKNYVTKLSPSWYPAVTFEPMAPCKPECEIKCPSLDENSDIEKTDVISKVRLGTLCYLYCLGREAKPWMNYTFLQPLPGLVSKSLTIIGAAGDLSQLPLAPDGAKRREL